MIHSDVSLENTLALQSLASHVADIGSVGDAQDAIEFGQANDFELRCLGEGSNVILMPRVLIGPSSQSWTASQRISIGST